jgi:hypothetical protein
MNHTFRSVDFHYNAEIEKHIRRHLYSSTKAGGTFLENILNVDQLLVSIESSTLLEKKTQGRMRTCFVFEAPEAIGRLGIGRRADYPSYPIEKETRDGMIIEYITLETLPTTRLFTLVCAWEKGRWQLITAYPGPSGEPFPNKKWDQEQHQRSQKFWDEYVLLKLKKV